jgi:hypothetical protein
MKYFLLVVALLLSTSITANASWCFVVSPDFPQAYEQSKAVFIGEVVKVAKSDVPLASTGKKLNKVTFKVEYSWKGAGFQEIGIPDLVVFASEGGVSSCKFDGYEDRWIAFEEGKKYLVYATETPQKELIVGPATRTMRLENASHDLKLLKNSGFFSVFTPKFGLPDMPLP